MAQVSDGQAEALRRVARFMRGEGSGLLGSDPEDRVGSGMLKWADRCDAMAARASRRLRVVEEPEPEELEEPGRVRAV